MIVPDLSVELPLWASGLTCLAGIDEAGRGAWAGPVSAAAVIFPPEADLCARLPGVRDSKLMSAGQRARWADAVRRAALCWGVGMATQEEIDQEGILPATRLAMTRALAQLEPPAQHLLIDAVRLPQVQLPQTVLIKGDTRVLSIAAASILAKTARDARMVELESEYPGYGFAAHKGYGTARHQRALAELGPCPLHRKSYAPVRERMFGREVGHF